MIAFVNLSYEFLLDLRFGPVTTYLTREFANVSIASSRRELRASTAFGVLGCSSLTFFGLGLLSPALGSGFDFPCG